MGNFSRNTFDRLKHYVGVRLQQGVPLIDADWNEQEDIRKFELQAFLKWFAGNGVPNDNDGFRILAAAGTTNNFDIKGGNGTALGAGRILVEGMDAMLESTMRYSNQPLYNNPTLAAKWGVAVITPLTTPGVAREDLVYIDVWEREVDSTEIGERVINKLYEIDEVAYVRFASVYRSFKDVNQFLNELKDLLKEKGGEKKLGGKSDSADQALTLIRDKNDK